MAQSGLQNGPGLLRRKHTRLAEHIAELRQSLPGRPGDHLLAQQADVCLPPSPVFLRQGVGPHKCGRQLHRLRFLQPPDDPQLLHLLLRVQAVSAFRLAGGNTHPQHLRQSFRRLLRQLLLRSRPGGPNGGENAAALGQNIQIRHAPELLPQLILPPPAEDQVCMGVHQSRGHQPSPGVDDPVALRRSRGPLPHGGHGLAM